MTRIIELQQSVSVAAVERPSESVILLSVTDDAVNDIPIESPR